MNTHAPTAPLQGVPGVAGSVQTGPLSCPQLRQTARDHDAQVNHQEYPTKAGRVLPQQVWEGSLSPENTCRVLPQQVWEGRLSLGEYSYRIKLLMLEWQECLNELEIATFHWSGTC